jgi:hypothetical protein
MYGYMVDVQQLKFIHQHLRAVLKWISTRFGVVFVITSIYRIPEKGKKPGVHNVMPVRGIDIRCHSDEVGKVIKRETNKHWKYDPNRPGKMVVRCHGKPLHLHIQVHPHTYEV